MMAKEDDPVLLLELSTGEYKLNREARKVQEIGDEYGVGVYPEQITDDASIVGKSQKLLRSTGEIGAQYKSQLKQDAEKITDLASNAIKGEFKDLKTFSPDEIGEKALEALVAHFDEILSPFRQRYDELNEIGKNLFVDTGDFVKLFERWSRLQNTKNVLGGAIISEKPIVATFLNDLTNVNTMEGIQNVRLRIRKLLRDQDTNSDNKFLLDKLDDYLSDNYKHFARPWKGTGPLKTDKAWQAQYDRAELS